MIPVAAPDWRRAIKESGRKRPFSTWFRPGAQAIAGGWLPPQAHGDTKGWTTKRLDYALLLGSKYDSL